MIPNHLNQGFIKFHPYVHPIANLRYVTNSLLVKVDIPIDTKRLVRISLYPSKIDLPNPYKSTIYQARPGRSTLPEAIPTLPDQVSSIFASIEDHSKIIQRSSLPSISNQPSKPQKKTPALQATMPRSALLITNISCAICWWGPSWSPGSEMRCLSRGSETRAEAMFTNR